MTQQRVLVILCGRTFKSICVSFSAASVARHSRCTDSPAGTSKGRDQREGVESLQGRTEETGWWREGKTGEGGEEEERGDYRGSNQGAGAQREESSNIKLQQMARKKRKQKENWEGDLLNV